MNKYIIQNDESGKQFIAGPTEKEMPIFPKCEDEVDENIEGTFKERLMDHMLAYDEWLEHIASLPKYEWQGEKREVGDVVVENEDFEFGFLPNSDGFGHCVKCGKGLYECGCKVAIPLSKAKEVKEKEGDLKSKYDKCRSILQELVYLKGIKGIASEADEYERRKPIAWAAAKKFLGETTKS